VNGERHPVDIDRLLSDLADQAVARAAGDRPATALSRIHARAYEDLRRRTRHRRMASAAVLAVVAALLAPSLAGRDGITEIFTEQGGAGPGGFGSSAPGSAPATGATTPGSAPTPVTTTAPADVGPPPESGPPPDPANPDAPLQVRPDGLGLIHFDQDYTSAMAALTAALGPPDDPGALYQPGSCLPGQQSVRWGDLSIVFMDLGGTLVFTGYRWGDPSIIGGGVAPAGPGTPPVGNPWGYQLGMVVPSYDAVVSRLRRDYPEAHRDTGPGVIPYVSVTLGRRVFKIGIDDSSRISRFWLFDDRQINCP
jgi:hypothetical protein